MRKFLYGLVALFMIGCGVFCWNTWNRQARFQERIAQLEWRLQTMQDNQETQLAKSSTHLELCRAESFAELAPPPEIIQVTHPPYTVASPDILCIDLKIDTPKAQAENAQEEERRQNPAFSEVRGEHLVRPDGTISLGTYGSVYVASMTPEQIKCVMEKHLSQYILDPKVSVDVSAYNSKKYYVIIDGGGFGQQVFAFPYTGYETVLDAISKINGLPAASKKCVWVARHAPAHSDCSQILPVDWHAITEDGATDTNHQLMAGDRIYIRNGLQIQVD